MSRSFFCFILFLAVTLFSSSFSRAEEEKFAYRYTDESGYVHIVSSLDLVPEIYRDGASPMRHMTFSKGKKETPDRKKGRATIRDLEGMAVELTSNKGRLSASALFDGVETRMANIDTGSEICVVTTKLAKALGYDIRMARKRLFLTPGGRLDAPVITLKSLTIGSVRVSNIRAVVSDFPWRGDTSAIIGMNFMSRFAFAIDSGENSLVFYSPISPGSSDSESASTDSAPTSGASTISSGSAP